MVIGCVLAWTSPCLPLLKSQSNYSTPLQLSSNDEEAWISAWTPIGAIIGALAAGIFTSFIGRKLTLIVFTVPWICTWILTNLASSIYLLYLARFISGIVVGLFCAALPMYVNEIAEDSIRGEHLITICTKYVISYVLLYFSCHLVFSKFHFHTPLLRQKIITRAMFISVHRYVGNNVPVVLNAGNITRLHFGHI